jgi:hypothetical protein
MVVRGSKMRLSVHANHAGRTKALKTSRGIFEHLRKSPRETNNEVDILL